MALPALRVQAASRSLNRAANCIPEILLAAPEIPHILDCCFSRFRGIRPRLPPLLQAVSMHVFIDARVFRWFFVDSGRDELG